MANIKIVVTVGLSDHDCFTADYMDSDEWVRMTVKEREQYIDNAILSAVKGSDFFDIELYDKDGHIFLE